MSEVLPFPSIEDRQAVHDLIRAYVEGKLSRNDMMRMIAYVIESYHASRIPVLGYSVCIVQYYGDSNLPIISIENAVEADSCPTCGAATSEARYLRTEKEHLDRDYDIESVSCLECGCVYWARGDNGRQVFRHEYEYE